MEGGFWKTDGGAGWESNIALRASDYKASSNVELPVYLKFYPHYNGWSLHLARVRFTRESGHQLR